MRSKSDSSKLLEKALKLMPKIVAQKTKNAKRQKAVIALFETVSKEIQRASKRQEKQRALANKKVHPWRACPAGQHWVDDYFRKYKPSSPKSPGKYPVAGFCRVSPGSLDFLDASEILKISQEHLADPFTLPSALDLGFKRAGANGNLYDREIGLWTHYWNEVLQPKVLLEPNLVKALVASESDFRQDAKATISKSKKIYALGLMQVRSDYPPILSKKGEIKDHFIGVTPQDLYDPNIGLAVGIRWLFHKKNLIEKRKKRELSWRDLILHYKGYVRSNGTLKPNAADELARFDRFYKKLSEAK